MLPSELVAVLATVDPDNYAAGTQTSDWVDAGDFAQLHGIVLVGAIGAGGSVAAKLRQATSSAGAGAKDITGKAITTLTQASPDASDKQAVINCKADELDLDNKFDFVCLSMTIAAATSDAGAIILGFTSRYEPASGFDLATVAEIVG